MFPIMLNLAGRLVVVVGGGPVGRRKARAVHAAGGRVRVIESDPSVQREPDVEWVCEPYSAAHLGGACLVFACATSAVNAQVAADATARGVWVNAATDTEQGDFHMPAVVRAGGLTVAVSTGGAAPALARRIREKLEAEFDTVFAAWLQLLNEIRGEVLATVSDESRRRELLGGFADWPWLDRIRSEGIDAVRAAMREQVAITAAGR